MQRPYAFHGHEFARRSYYYHGHYYHAYYGRYYYHGYYLNPYYPAYYYNPYYYGWLANPWVTPAAYAWGWNANPWYGYYGVYFTPYPAYAGPSFWLADYLIATSLSEAYQAQAAALNNPAPLTPEVKQLIADEVKQQVTLEYNESKTGEPNAGVSSVQQLLDDGRPHVFVAGQDLDVVDASGNECALSEGDAIQLRGALQGDGPATLTVLASKGGRECPRGDLVSVNLTDLQEMQNHMRQTIDQGMQELQQKQGSAGLPTVPGSANKPPAESATALAAPPPPPESEVKTQIDGQLSDADRVVADAGAGGPSATASDTAQPPTQEINFEPGKTSMADVEAKLGRPTKTIVMGDKTICTYADHTKVTFKGGTVSSIE